MTSPAYERDLPADPRVRRDELPIIHRCVCGHALNWHWHTSPHGGVVTSARNGNRCPAGSCLCTKAEWDGADPARLPAVELPTSLA